VKSLCVFCGSSSGARPDYAAAAGALGRVLAARGIGLVYGGAKVGLMGLLADACLAGGGRVTGVMPTSLVEKEVAHGGLTAFHEVASMHERKARMADLSDGFVALPGGAGTLEELFEVWTWGQLGYHGKPVAFLNVAGYYEPLLRFIDHAVDERFLRREHADMVIVETDPGRLIDACAAYAPKHAAKWITAGER
jgi:hypothetical protein